MFISVCSGHAGYYNTGIIIIVTIPYKHCCLALLATCQPGHHGPITHPGSVVGSQMQ